jgi:hypothetical protein
MSCCFASHDVERALCRFWLRGQCVKSDQCEFLHTLPQESDVTGIVSAMSRTELATQPVPAEEPPVEDFPLLGRSGPAPKHDPGRSRFASAAKKGAAAPTPARMTSTPANTKPTSRTSPRLRLRSPSLLPTLPTGESLNTMYMTYRQRALQLGAARNACLSRAADAWRRGDGAAAKRFSKDAHELNKKMVEESGDAARGIVRERMRAAVEAVRGRDAGWSDDARDRVERGRVCGGELGVVLGVASISAAGEGGKGLNAEERMECLMDLHGLHAAEGVEALQEFLVEVSRQAYLGECRSDGDAIAREGAVFWIRYAFRLLVACTAADDKPQHTLSSGKRSTQVHKTPQGGLPRHDWAQPSASGSSSGGTPGASETGWSAWTGSHTSESRKRWLEMNWLS